MKLWLAILLLGVMLTACDTRGSDHSGAPLLVFGRTGMGPGEFSYPRAAVAGPDGHFYVVDKAARIQCFTQAGQYVHEWRMPEKLAGKPTGLGIGPQGNIYVADTHYSRVLIFDSHGEALGQFGGFGEGPGQFGLPTDVAVAHDGSIYVSEYGLNDRISKFSPEHEFLFSIGGSEEVQFRRPQSLLTGADDTLWVADSCHHRICHFDPAGNLMGTFGGSGRGPGELRFPYGLDWLSDGTLVVAEYGNNRVQRFDQAGHSLGTWGLAGRKPGELAYPWAVVAGQDDQIIIIDSGNNRVQIINGRASDTWQLP